MEIETVRWETREQRKGETVGSEKIPGQVFGVQARRTQQRRRRRGAWHPVEWNPAYVVVGFVLVFALLTAVLLYLQTS